MALVPESLLMGCLVSPHVQRLSIACLHQVHTNIVIFNLHDSCPLTAKEFIPLLQQHGVYIIPFRCTTCIFCTRLSHVMGFHQHLSSGWKRMAVGS